MTTAWVTGGAGGLGAAFARTLAERGHDLVLVDVRAAALHDLCRRIGRDLGVKATALPADLAQRDEIERVAGELAEQEDLAVLVNNAGFGHKGALSETPPERQLAQVDVMVTATVRLCRAALPRLQARGEGAIINVSSVGAFKPGTEWAIYGAAKRFVLHYTESLAQELEGTGVRAQALCPGFTHTGFHDASGAPESKSSVPDTLWLNPDEVARASLDGLGERVVFVPGPRHYLHLATTYSGSFRRGLFAALRRIEGSKSWL